jgi:hypothetical protein
VEYRDGFSRRGRAGAGDVNAIGWGLIGSEAGRGVCRIFFPMGLTPFACIPLPDCARVVYPDGHVESLTRACSVDEILLGNSEYYVCPDAPYKNRLASDEQLENGTTYFICAAANAQPFTEKKPPLRILPRFSRRQGRELGSAGSRTKVFDLHSAAMQQLESMDRPPKHLLRLVFVRHCLQALRLPRTSLEQLVAEPALDVPAPAPADLPPILKSAARCELGLYVSRRQEFYLRRARRRRKVMWKPVLQSISETSPVVEFHPPVAQPQSDSSCSKKFSPPRPDSAVPRKNISPPRKQVFANNISPPPPPQPVAKFSNPSRSTNGSYARSLYMA